MALHIIGLGLSGEKDITFRGFEAVKKCEIVYLENYTSRLNCSKEDLEKFFCRKIFLATRKMVESDDNEILKNVADFGAYHRDSEGKKEWFGACKVR